jgi:hypothetical protein
MIWVFQWLSTPSQAGMDTLSGTVWLALWFCDRGSQSDRLTLAAHSASDGSVDPGGSVAKRGWPLVCGLESVASGVVAPLPPPLT